MSDLLDKHWDTDSFGDPADYNRTDDESLGAFRVGDTVIFLEDNEEGGFEDDRGKIVGIAHMGEGLFNPVAHNVLLVHIEGYSDPVAVPPDSVEAI